MPSIFSSKRTLRVKRVIRGLQPSPSSPSRLAPSSVARICCRNSSPSSAVASTTLPLAEDEPRADDVVAEVDRGELGVRDHAFGGVLDRAVEDLAVGHVAEAGRDDALAALDPERAGRCRRRRCGRSSPRSKRSLIRPSAPPRRPSRAGRRRRRSPRTPASVIPACAAAASVGYSTSAQRTSSARARRLAGSPACCSSFRRSGSSCDAGVDVLGRADRQPGVLVRRPGSASIGGSSPSSSSGASSAQSRSARKRSGPQLIRGR